MTLGLHFGWVTADQWEVAEAGVVAVSSDMEV